jgi:hypothetical protein
MNKIILFVILSTTPIIAAGIGFWLGSWSIALLTLFLSGIAIGLLLQLPRWIASRNKYLGP